MSDRRDTITRLQAQRDQLIEEVRCTRAERDRAIEEADMMEAARDELQRELGALRRRRHLCPPAARARSRRVPDGGRLMAFKVGTVTCQCANVMGMPTDSGTCDECGEKKTTWGEGSLSKLEAWAKEHSETHAS